MSIYKLPLGIRVPELDEYPNGYDVHEINKARNSSNIIEGYKLNEVHNELFTHYAEVNIDADTVWNLFVSLSNKLLGHTAYGIIGFKDEKPILSDFAYKQSIIDIFKEYKFELTNDGYIQFGMAYYDEATMDEIFITSFKYLQVWTSNKNLLVEALEEFDLLEQEKLNFIDEFPVVSEALSTDTIEGVRHYSEVISGIEEEFAILEQSH